jgi:hypothetical protein
MIKKLLTTWGVGQSNKKIFSVAKIKIMARKNWFQTRKVYFFCLQKIKFPYLKYAFILASISGL